MQKCPIAVPSMPSKTRMAVHTSQKCRPTSSILLVHPAIEMALVGIAVAQRVRRHNVAREHEIARPANRRPQAIEGEMVFDLRGTANGTAGAGQKDRGSWCHDVKAPCYR